MKQIPFERPSIGKEEIKAVTKVLKSGWLTMGPETQAFEEEFAKYVGAKHAIAVNSATSGLFLALKALGIKNGDEVIVPSFTFAATANVVVHCGATPVFVDIREDDFTMDQKSLDAAITKKTKAIIPVHYAANRAHIKTSIPVIEDSAHLIEKDGENIKAFASCYSFYATKTSDSKVADWLRMARLHGLSRDAWKRYGLQSKWVYTVEFSGWKFNTTDLNSSIGRVQLKRLPSFEKRRRHVVDLYNKLLGLKNKGTHLYPILVENRDDFFNFMKENGIGCSFNFTPLHQQPAFKGYKNKKLPITEYVGPRVATIPLDAVVTDKEVEKIAKLINKYNYRKTSV